MKSKIILIVVILAVLGGAFYWFQWRPSEIRKECAKSSELSGFTGLGLSKYLPENQKQEIVESEYKNCLREHGLEK